MATLRPVNRYTIIILIGLLFIVLILFTGSSENLMVQSAQAFVSDDPRVPITTENVVNGEFYGKSNNATWRSEDSFSFMQRSTGDIVLYNISNADKRVVIRAGQVIQRPWKTFFSNDLGYVLVAFSPQRVFRSTILARYAVHDGGTGEMVKEIKTPGEGEGPGGQAFQLGVWGNDNRTVFLVYRNDLYGVRVGGGDLGAKRFTSDGSDAIFNGIADWVFEEEIFVSTSTAVYTSAQGNYVSYLKFDDTVVEQINYNLYGEYDREPYFDAEYQYPKYGSVRYPKSGRSNPTVSLHVVKIGDPTCWKATTPLPSCNWDVPINTLMGSKTHTKDNFIIGQFRWHDNDENIFTLLIFNRIQNKSWILECTVDSRNCKVIKSNEISNGWLDNAPLYRYGNMYLSLSSVPQGDLDYMHVTGYSKEITKYYTRGRYSVDEIVKILRIGGKDVLIFKAPLLGNENGEVVIRDVTQQHYYATYLDRDDAPVCISCYGDCTYNTAKFDESGNGLSFLNSCEKQESVLQVHLVKINDDLSVKAELHLEDNKELEKSISGLRLPEVEYAFIPYELNGKSYNLSVKTIGPKGWKQAGKHKYPIVMDQYSGPNSQKVTRKFAPNDWSMSLASNEEHPVVYVIVDGIGSGRQSSSLAFEIYRNLGDKEIHDKLFAMKWLLGEYKSLDPGRTLIWGWSYGGYTSAMTLGKDTEGIFKCGISVAPVVNWYYYDTMYTERYMSTPSDNPSGYNSSNIIRYVDNFSSKKFMLVHGNADDNVHYQQSMVLARALQTRAILFRLMSYPDENHSLSSVRLHLFKTLEDFAFNSCFRKD